MRKYLVDVIFGLAMFAVGGFGGAYYMWHQRGGECKVIGELKAPFYVQGYDKQGSGFNGGFPDGSLVVCEGGSMYRKK